MAKIYTALNKEKAEFNYIISLPNYIIFAKMIKLNFHPQKWKFSEKVNEKWKFTSQHLKNKNFILFWNILLQIKIRCDIMITYKDL